MSEEFSSSKPVIKTSTFRQSGWREVATGQIHEFYGTDVPAQDGTFEKLWDNVINTVSTSIPFAFSSPSAAE